MYKYQNFYSKNIIIICFVFDKRQRYIFYSRCVNKMTDPRTVRNLIYKQNGKDMSSEVRIVIVKR